MNCASSSVAIALGLTLVESPGLVYGWAHGELGRRRSLSLSLSTIGHHAAASARGGRAASSGLARADSRDQLWPRLAQGHAPRHAQDLGDRVRRRRLRDQRHQHARRRGALARHCDALEARPLPGHHAREPRGLHNHEPAD